MQGSIGVPTEYTQATMPAASAVASGTTVYNSTYNVRMRSNGTRWVPLSSFTVDQNTRSDVVTGTIAESLMHSVDVSDAVRYMGPKGRLKISTCCNFPASANAKNIRARIGTSAGTGGTLFFDSTSTNVAGVVDETTIYARGSETAQGCAAAAVPASGGFGFPNSITGLNFATGGSDVVISFLAAPTGAGEVVTFNWYSIVIEPGF